METQAYLAVKGVSTLVTLEKDKIKSYPLDMKNQWSIGRTTPTNFPDISFDSVIVGRKHGALVSIEQKWYYVDNGSVNGTYINERKLEVLPDGRTSPYELHNGDIIQIDSDDLQNPDERGIWMMFSSEGLGDKWNEYPMDNKSEVVVGRDETICDIVIPYPYISAQHLKIGYANDHYFIVDCGSLAGTWLNGHKLKHGEVLKDKDKICFCDCMIVLSNNKLFYNTNDLRKETTTESERRIILKADIKTRKVPNNNGHGQKELIRNVKVEVKEGSLVALLGSSGAGKSTVMNCMNGMDTKGAEGEITYKGIDLLKDFDRVKYLIGSVPQDEVFHPMLSVEEELREAAILRLPKDTKRAEIKEHVNKTIHQLKLDEVRKNRISKCSGGEQKRVNIAIELVADRQLLCLDEPDAGLDPGMKAELFAILGDLAHKEGKTILVIIHDVSDIKMFDQIIMMTKMDNVGRLAFSGSPDEAEAYFGVEMKEIYGLLAENPEKYIKSEE